MQLKDGQGLRVFDGKNRMRFFFFLKHDGGMQVQEKVAADGFVNIDGRC
jgi:hypothetical protein